MKDKVSAGKSKAAKVAMIAAGVSLGVALSVCAIVTRGVKNCLSTIDGLRDNSNQ